MVVSYSLVDKKGMDLFLFKLPNTPFQNGIAFFFWKPLLVLLFATFIYFQITVKLKILALWKNDWLRALVGAFATLGSYGLICVVLQFESVSAVVALRQVSVLMVVYWGCWKLREPFGRERLLAGGLIIFGVLLIGR